ncbi:MAG: hypothetical protein V3T00_05575 [bacterium]
MLDATELGMPVFDFQIGLSKIAKHDYFPRRDHSSAGLDGGGR